MAEIGFYHLTRTGIEQALPRLLRRVLDEGARAMVRCGVPERRAALGAALWADPGWLPHNSEADENPDLQPIWLTAGDAPALNGARFLFLVDGADSSRLDDYVRVFDLFDGRDEAATAAARARFASARAAGHRLTYWQQTDRGWEKG